MDEVIYDGRPGIATPEGLSWLSAYVALETKDFTTEYVDGEWLHVMEAESVILDDWPDEAYFGGSYTDHEWRQWWRALAIRWDVDEDCIFKINFLTGFDSTVFERDETNLIEVT